MSNAAAAERPMIKVVVSWAMVAVAMIIGVFALSFLGDLGIPSDNGASGLFLDWIKRIGWALFAVGFLIAPLVALRNPGRAGVGFLAVMPLAAFCITYADFYYLASFSHGLGSVEFLRLSTAAGLTLVFFIPIVGPLLAFRNHRIAGIVFVVGCLLAVVVFGWSRWTSIFFPTLSITTGFFLVFGLFWLATDHLRWPIPLPSRPRNMVRQFAGIVTTGFLIFCATVLVTTGRDAYFSSMWNPDCGLPTPVTRAKKGGHAVLTARIVYVGLTLRTRLQIGKYPDAIRDPRLGEWAIGVVQERFWGISPRWPHLVLLTNFLYWNGATYFIDGFDEHGILSVVPVVGGGIGCSRTRVVEDALVDLHLVRQEPLKGAAIVGSVRQPGTYYSMVPPPDAPEALVGAQIDVSGPTGTKTVTTDASGVYQLDGLTAGEYTVRLHVPEGQVAGLVRVDGSRPDESVRQIRLKNDELSECDFHLDWDKTARH